MENPVCSLEGKFDQCSSSSTTVVCDKDRDQVTFDYAHFDTNLNNKLKRHNMMNRHRWIMPYCTIAAVLIALGALLGLIVVYIELCRANSILDINRELIHAQDLKMLNQTHALDQLRTRLQYIQGPSGGITGRRVASNPAAQSSADAGATGDLAASRGNVYIRWGVDDCPNTSSLVYSGVAASGSSLSVAKGSGSNVLCMTPEPEYGPVIPGRQDPRGRIYSIEYRNGNDFGDQGDLHGHDVPCAACLTGGGRQAVLMVPGKASCPENWTREYYGILMSSRYNNMRTSYTCVDIDAESRPGTMAEDGNSSLLYPVEGVCGTGGGLPCGPYIDGNELQCVVCTK